MVCGDILDSGEKGVGQGMNSGDWLVMVDGARWGGRWSSGWGGSEGGGK
jgi:hypothetical protein